MDEYELQNINAFFTNWQWFSMNYLETCKDGIKNQDEVGIDCGGSCPELCGNLLSFE